MGLAWSFGLTHSVAPNFNAAWLERRERITKVKLRGVDVNSNDTRGTARFCAHDGSQAHSAQSENSNSGALHVMRVNILHYSLDVGRVQDSAVSSGNAATKQAYTIQRRFLWNLELSNCLNVAPSR